LLSRKKIHHGPALPWCLVGLTLAGGLTRAAEPRATVALVVDTSGSLTRADLTEARDLATGVLQALPPGSEVAVFSFDDASRVVLPRTADADAVKRAIDGLKVAGKYTALHDALFDASRYLRDAAGAQRAILLVTDGKDENSALNLEDGLKVAQETLIPVFCVGVGRVEERVLRRIAKLTGGEYFPSHEANASAIAKRILAAPAPPVAAVPSTAETPSPVAAPRARGLEEAPPAFYRSPLLWAGAGLLLLVAATALALVGRKPAASARPVASVASGPSRLDTGQQEAFPGKEALSGKKALAGTVLTRLDLAGEPVDKTVLLMDKPVLAVTRGERKGEVFPLSGESSISIGRAPANDVVLDDASVSSQHCRIRPEPGGFVVHDMKSTNGTQVNGRPVDRHRLAEGDVIQVGETSLQYRRERKRGV
jgi:FHA domain-containing protein/von Willebrand factor type A domain-containing protein